MKFTQQISAGAVALGLLVAVPAFAQAPQFKLPEVGNQTPAAPAAATPQAAAPAAAAPAAPTITYTEAQIMEAYGWLLAARNNMAELEFTPAQIEAMAKGMTAAATGKSLSYDGQQMGQQIQALLQKKQQVFLGKIRTANQADTATYFRKLADNKAVKELAGSNGLRYEILKEGRGQIAKEGQVVKMHYTGAFPNGQIFDSSLQQQQGTTLPDPVEVLVKPGSMIEGFVAALTHMPVGSKWRLHIPPHLAYGDDGFQGIPPAATLIFEVEVFEVKDAPAEPAKK